MTQTEVSPMRAAEGFLTNDGQFFESSSEARLHEAQTKLESACLSIGVDPEKLISALDQMTSTAKEFLDAKAEVDHHVEHTDGLIDHSNTEGTQERPETVQQQPIGQRELVPNMGSGVSAEAVRDPGALDGSGVRGDDAPDVRSNEDLATVASPEAPAARGDEWNTDIRKVTVGSIEEETAHARNRRTRRPT